MRLEKQKNLNQNYEIFHEKYQKVRITFNLNNSKSKRLI